MIIWTGWGIFTAVIGIFGFVLPVIISENISGNEEYLKHHTWLWLIGMGLAALLNYGFYKLLTRQKGRVVIDKASGREFLLEKSNSLFFIPVKWWSFIFLAFGILWLFIGDK